MRIKLGNGLLPLNLLTWLLIATIFFFPYEVLRISIGVPFVLFFPGYTVVMALFPKKEGISGIERVALSFGISITMVPLIGLILNYTPWGITLESGLYSIAAFILIMSIIAWGRRRRLEEGERFNIEFQLRLPNWGGSAWDKALSLVLVIAILGALGVLGYAIAAPKVGEKFTEFYILGQEGKAADYLEELKVGEEGKVVVCIVNNEYETVTYRVEVVLDGVKNNEVEGITLEHEEKWEGEISFVPQVAGEDQKLELLLYKDEETEPYSTPLRLWINVIESR